ncbi:MAG: metal-dependent hydrolase [Pseudomonadota bacterium]
MATDLVARRFSAPLSADIPRDWLPGASALAAMLDTYTVLVPANEAFYMRTINACLPKLADPALREAAQAFIHQEAEHGVAHKRYWRNLERQGYRFRGFERAVDRYCFRMLERILPLPVRLSMVSCVEHINAFMAHEFLAQGILAEAHPEVRALMEWHFAEEIEHKHVSFDVLGAVSPSYGMRLLGLAVTAPFFYSVMSFGMLRFLAQGRRLSQGSTWASLSRHLFGGHGMLLRTLKHLLAYARPGFHPEQLDDAALAQAVIERYGAGGHDWLPPAERGRPRPMPKPMAA